jgi:hypothetical protein
MATAFQPGAFQAAGFQIVAVTQQQGGGYGWNAWDHEARRRIEQKRLLEEIERLEEHIAEEREVPPALIRLESQVRAYAAPMPTQATRAVRRAIKVQTTDAFLHAERVLRAFEDEEEDFAALILLALH